MAVLAVVVPLVRDEGRHVEELREGDARRDLLVQTRGVLEPLQVERHHDRELLHRQLLRRLLERGRGKEGRVREDANPWTLVLKVINVLEKAYRLLL